MEPAKLTGTIPLEQYTRILHTELVKQINLICIYLLTTAETTMVLLFISTQVDLLSVIKVRMQKC